MARGKLFEVAIIEHPTEQESKNGKGSSLVMGPIPVVAPDAQAACISAVLTNGKASAMDMNRVEVIVRPFA